MLLQDTHICTCICYFPTHTQMIALSFSRPVQVITLEMPQYYLTGVLAYSEQNQPVYITTQHRETESGQNKGHRRSLCVQWYKHVPYKHACTSLTVIQIYTLDCLSKAQNHEAQCMPGHGR